MDQFIKVVKTSRPLLWFSHFTSLLYGGLQSHSFQINSFPFILSIIIFSLPFSLFIYAINDYYDLKTDSLNPRKDTIFGEKHDKSSISKLRLWGFTGLAISLFLSYFLGLPVLIAIIVLFIILYSYSAPPLRLKSAPIMDSLAGGALYSYLTVIIGYLVFTRNGVQLSDILQPIFILFALFGLFGQLIGAILDEIPDKKANIHTSAVVFGSNKVISACILILFVCLYLARHNLLFVIPIVAIIVICLFGYSVKWRASYFMQTLGGAFIPVTFFVISLLLYFVNSNLLTI